jgi:hypothetical protein
MNGVQQAWRGLSRTGGPAVPAGVGSFALISDMQLPLTRKELS